ncbi:MAG: hypothetical protein JW808_04150 [Victivallales bacterium]|nr:hypothetical protein [Victivallales bacterium]
MKEKKLESLISLLDDDNSNVANAAMYELLTEDPESVRINQLMAELQESPALRRQIHQLQAIQTNRRRRKWLSSQFAEDGESLLQGLANINLVWYSELNSFDMSDLWRDLISDASKARPRSPRRLAAFMLKSGFTVCTENMQDSDVFSLGPVLEDRFGTDVLMAGIALELGAVFGLHGSIIHTEHGFALIVSNTHDKRKKAPFLGEVIIPSLMWKVVKPEKVLPLEVWPCSRILKYITAMLFCNSVCAQSPRYVQIFGSCLAGRRETSSLGDLLPYPFGEKKH